MTNSLENLRASNSDLLSGVAGEAWADPDVRAASLLPDWSRGHVLTHLARNADAIARTVDGALRGERVARYPDGPAGRNADIEAGAGRAPAELIADLAAAGERLDELFAAVDAADGWALGCDDRTTAEYALARWREVEIHRVDLGGSYRASDWPSSFVAYLLPTLVTTVGERSNGSLRITVTAPGSVVTELAGAVWTCGEAPDAAEVTGPDWALLAWALGRPEAAQDALNRTPPLKPWT